MVKLDTFLISTFIDINKLSTWLIIVDNGILKGRKFYHSPLLFGILFSSSRVYFRMKTLRNTWQMYDSKKVIILHIFFYFWTINNFELMLFWYQVFFINFWWKWYQFHYQLDNPKKVDNYQLFINHYQKSIKMVLIISNFYQLLSTSDVDNINNHFNLTNKTWNLISKNNLIISTFFELILINYYQYQKLIISIELLTIGQKKTTILMTKKRVDNYNFPFFELISIPDLIHPPLFFVKCVCTKMFSKTINSVLITNYHGMVFFDLFNYVFIFVTFLKDDFARKVQCRLIIFLSRHHGKENKIDLHFWKTVAITSET